MIIGEFDNIIGIKNDSVISTENFCYFIFTYVVLKVRSITQINTFKYPAQAP